MRHLLAIEAFFRSRLRPDETGLVEWMAAVVVVLIMLAIIAVAMPGITQGVIDNLKAGLGV